jgi:glycosyl hydrolase family 20
VTDYEKAIIKTKLVPYPEKIEFRDGYFILDAKKKIEISCPDMKEADKEKFADDLKAYFNVEPNISYSKNVTTNFEHPEAYLIRIADNIEINAKQSIGVFHALKTLRQLAETERGVLEFSHYFFPKCTIEDKPFFNFRSIHLCWFPETDYLLLEKYIRLAAYYKFNYVILEFWGIFPFKSHPELSYPGLVEPEKIKKLLQVGKELGIKFIPAYNFLGHAAGARGKSGKHSILDVHPELDSLFEPGGWSWCLSNPEVDKIHRDVIDELVESFDEPEYFHIGFDEAWDLATCASCRSANIKDLMKKRILSLHEILRRKKIKTMIWHDMLLEKNDPRWKPFLANGRAEHRTWELLDELPKDLIIVDWEYGKKAKREGIEIDGWPTISHFKEKGFPVIAATWDSENCTISFGKAAKEEQIFGIMATTWQTVDHAMPNILYFNAQVAWGTDGLYDDSNFRDSEYYPFAKFSFERHSRSIFQDMKLTEYEDFGRIKKQLIQQWS